MGRTVDADVVKKRLAELKFKGELADYDTEIHNVFESVVDTTKTVIDTEKVIEQLEKMIEAKHKLMLREDRDEIRYFYEMNILKEVLEIVKAGGNAFDCDLMAELDIEEEEELEV